MAAPPAETGPPIDLPDPSEVQPRDLVIDQRGLGYLRGADGGLTPYGHSVAADRPISPRAPGSTMYTAGYFIVRRLPKLPSIHSIVASW